MDWTFVSKTEMIINLFGFACPPDFLDGPSCMDLMCSQNYPL
jgi:hypothetical protein